MRLYGRDKVCKSEEVLVRVVKLYDGNGVETSFTPSVALRVDSGLL